MIKLKKELREWGGALLFAVMVATPLRWAVAEPYKVPTSSMEGTILVGDYILVSKYHYGARTANTLLQIPLTFQKIWGTEIPSYLDWIQLPTFRLPGFSEIKRNDPVVFNFPGELENPKDMRTYYVKRCVGIAGDTIQIINGKLLVNGQETSGTENQQSSYFVKSQSELKERFFDKYGINDYNLVFDGYLIHCNESTASELKSNPLISDVQAIINPGENTYPQYAGNNWSIDNYGPLFIPKKGYVIALDEINLKKYQHLILNYENLDDARIKNGKLYINGEAVDNYEFKQDYYFMMGDNRHNSLDSRFWGFAPMDHVVGKPLFTWFSKDMKGNLLDIRWNRCFKSID